MHTWTLLQIYIQSCAQSSDQRTLEISTCSYVIYHHAKCHQLSMNIVEVLVILNQLAMAAMPLKMQCQYISSHKMSAKTGT